MEKKTTSQAIAVSNSLPLFSRWLLLMLFVSFAEINNGCSRPCNFCTVQAFSSFSPVYRTPNQMKLPHHYSNRLFHTHSVTKALSNEYGRSYRNYRMDYITPRTSRMLSSYSNESPQQTQNYPKADPLVVKASKALRRSSWISWWIQVILTTVSSIILIFAKSVLSAQSAGGLKTGVGGLFLAGTGVSLSFLSIIWTWGETRLSRRLLRRRNTTRISAASITRRAVTIGVTINLIGMTATLLGAEQIVGILAARSLSFQSLGASGGGLGVNSAGNFVSQTLQPLDVLIVQANTNTLLSHFLSLFLLLWWGKRWLLRLDPPSSVDDDDNNDRNTKRSGKERNT